MARRKAWSGASLPAFGESSYCLVLKGLDKKRFIREFGRKRPNRQALRATIPNRPCLRRYYLAKGIKAENTAWSYPPGQTIRPHSPLVYSIEGFASFTDASEAFLYAAVLKSYFANPVKIVQINRG